MERHSSFHVITYIINSGHVNWMHFKTNQLCKTRKLSKHVPFYVIFLFFRRSYFILKKGLLYQFRLCGWDHCSSSQIYCLVQHLPLDKVLGRILRTQGLAKLLGNWVKHTSKLRQVSVSRCWGAHWLIIFWGDPKKLAGIHRLWRAGKQMLTLAKWRWWCLVAVVVVVVVVAASVSMSAIHWHSSNVL